MEWKCTDFDPSGMQRCLASGKDTASLVKHYKENHPSPFPPFSVCASCGFMEKDHIGILCPTDDRVISVTQRIN
jgi:hypothetical protein